MRPVPLFWLQLLTAAAAAAAEETATAAAIAPIPAPVPITPAAASPHPLATLFFPHAGQQMRSMDGNDGRHDVGQAVPWLASLARAFPGSLRSLDRQPVQSREAVSAIEEFAGPLVRFATGGQPVAADVEQLIDSIPHLARSANALKEADKVNLSSLDITSPPSNVVSHVLGGGEIPGIDRTELDRVVREHLKRMSETADRVMRGEHVDNLEKILLPLEKVPMEMVMTSLQGKTLPGLSDAETAKIREYYTKQLPSHAPKDADTSSPDSSALSALGAMVQLLPPNYDIGRIPPEFIKSMMEGRVPDLTLLPADLQIRGNIQLSDDDVLLLQNYLNAGKDQARSLIKSLNSSVTEIVQQLAVSVYKPEVNRSAVYDISLVTHEVVDIEANKAKQDRNVIYTIAWVAVALMVATLVTLWLSYKKYGSLMIIIVVLCFQFSFVMADDASSVDADQCAFFHYQIPLFITNLAQILIYTSLFIGGLFIVSPALTRIILTSCAVGGLAILPTIISYLSPLSLNGYYATGVIYIHGLYETRLLNGRDKGLVQKLSFWLLLTCMTLLNYAFEIDDYFWILVRISSTVTLTSKIGIQSLPCYRSHFAIVSIVSAGLHQIDHQFVNLIIASLNLVIIGNATKFTYRRYGSFVVLFIFSIIFFTWKKYSLTVDFHTTAFYCSEMILVVHIYTM